MQLQCHLGKSLSPYVPGVDLYCTAGKVTMEGSSLVSYKSRINKKFKLKKASRHFPDQRHMMRKLMDARPRLSGEADREIQANQEMKHNHLEDSRSFPAAKRSRKHRCTTKARTCNRACARKCSTFSVPQLTKNSFLKRFLGQF